MQQDLNQEEALNCVEQFQRLLIQLHTSISKSEHQSNQFEIDDYTEKIQDYNENSEQINLIGKKIELISFLEQLKRLTNELKGKFPQAQKQSSRVTSQQESHVSRPDYISIPSKISNLSQQYQQNKNIKTIAFDFEQYFIDQMKQVNPDLIAEQKINEGEDYFFNQIFDSLNQIFQQLIQNLYSKTESRENSRLQNSFQQQSTEENQQSYDSLILQQNETILQNSVISELIKIEQAEQCQVMCFNKNDSLIFTGIGNKIQIRNYYQGQLKKYRKPLVGHQGNVTTIVFSRIQDQNFISGAEVGQNSIIMWSFVSNDWVQTYPNRQEQGGFRSMILNLMNDKLYTSDQEGRIKIWNVNFSKKIFDLIYEFEKQQGQVRSITLNYSQTQLISCGENNNLIIWSKKSEQNWINCQEIKFQSQPMRVKFLNEVFFIVGTQTDGHLYEYRKQRKKETYKETAKIQLDLEKEDLWGFPLKHQNKEFYFAKHNKFFYILKSSHSKMQITAKLEFSNPQIYGTLSQKKKILIVWHNGFLNLYKLNY